jgi:hypothetical protein
MLFLFSNDTIGVLIAIIVLSFNTIIFFISIKNKIQIFTAVKNISNIVSNELRLQFLRLSLVGAVVPHVPSTTVEVTDDELRELLEIILIEIGNTNMISAEYLASLGLYTNTVIAYLEALGYIIF